MWSVYIVMCQDHTLYTGIAKDVEKRVAQHNAAKGAKYTRSRLPVILCYQEQNLSHGDALRRERAIKKLPRQSKIDLFGHYFTIKSKIITE